jgi:hypothetical protein
MTWDAVGYPGGGEGLAKRPNRRQRDIAGIGKAKALPLINTDDTDQELGHRKNRDFNHKGHPFDSPSSLRAGYGTQRGYRGADLDRSTPGRAAHSR